MPADFAPGQWAVILGGSSGFGLATAQVLADHGMNLCIVHRDRRSQLAQIEPEFEKLRGAGVSVQTHNTDALAAVKRGAVLDSLADALGEGRVRVLLHSIAFGNLKPLAPPPTRAARDATQKLAVALGLEGERVQDALDELFARGAAAAHPLASPPRYSETDFLEEEDFSRTIFNMGTSLLGWVQELFERKLFADDARIFGLTSEGNHVRGGVTRPLQPQRSRSNPSPGRSQSSTRPMGSAATSFNRGSPRRPPWLRSPAAIK